jgi:hypothetical protein
VVSHLGIILEPASKEVPEPFLVTLNVVIEGSVFIGFFD